MYAARFNTGQTLWAQREYRSLSEHNNVTDNVECGLLSCRLMVEIVQRKITLKDIRSVDKLQLRIRPESLIMLIALTYVACKRLATQNE